jgi:hypothetical protein
MLILIGTWSLKGTGLDDPVIHTTRSRDPNPPVNRCLLFSSWDTIWKQSCTKAFVDNKHVVQKNNNNFGKLLYVVVKNQNTYDNDFKSCSTQTKGSSDIQEKDLIY